MPIDPAQLVPSISRLERENIIWIATTRPDGRPHLVPIWFVWHANKAWICTPRNSQKVRNLDTMPYISFSLEDGLKPVILEGTVVLHFDPPWPAAIASLFAEKYDWDITSPDASDHMLIEVTPQRMISW